MVKRTVLAERQSKDLAACAAITGQHVSMDGWNTLPSEMNETRIKPDNIQIEMGPYVNGTTKQMENIGLVQEIMPVEREFGRHNIGDQLVQNVEVL